MRKTLVVLLALAMLVVLFVPAAAASTPDKDKDNVKLKVFVHYPKQGKPGGQPAPCDPTNTSPTGYGLTGWSLPGPFTYRVNYGTIPSSVKNAQAAIAASFAVWQGSGITFTEGTQTSARSYKRDGQNVVVWGSVPGGAIAVTYTWYNPSTGYAVEVDTVMGRSLPWSYTDAANPDAACGDLYSYDVQNILTHEVGHWMGLDDLYSSADHDLTMYGYGDKGELKKDTLEAGDQNGLRDLY